MSTKRVPTAVLISGSGSNLQALIDAAKHPDYPAKITLVISNRADAYGLERAAKAGIPTRILPHQDFANREAYDAALQALLVEAGIELICLAGFMRILSEGFVQLWEGKMLNIHPSLLPDYRGLNTHQRVLNAKEAMHGCTVHMVTAELDAGPTILQAAVPVHSDDTAETLAARVLEKEHVIYPEALAMVASGAFPPPPADEA